MNTDEQALQVDDLDEAGNPSATGLLKADRFRESRL
jgi:hypothetical protein